MFNIGPEELLLILVLALIFLGPKKLPDVARQIGKGLREFRNLSNNARRELMDNVKEVSFDDPPPTESASPNGKLENGQVEGKKTKTKTKDKSKDKSKAQNDEPVIAGEAAETPVAASGDSGEGAAAIGTADPPGGEGTAALPAAGDATGAPAAGVVTADDAVDAGAPSGAAVVGPSDTGSTETD
jgi:Tat protein translocase TatB subunit